MLDKLKERNQNSLHLVEKMEKVMLELGYVPHQIEDFDDSCGILIRFSDGVTISISD